MRRNSSGGESVPCMVAGKRVYAIGDIHGRADLLAGLLDQIETDLALNGSRDAAPCLVFLGDYIDRGLESRRCLDLLIDWAGRSTETHFLIGRHDLAMLRFLDAPETGASWLRMGGAETIYSYGLRAPSGKDDIAELRRLSAALGAAMPVEHRRFMMNLKLHLRLGDYLFVHAGLRPGVALERQTEDDLVSIREPFLSSREQWPFIIVHGHSPMERVVAEGRRIAIDTGAYLTGRLSAVCLEGREMRLFST